MIQRGAIVDLPAETLGVKVGPVGELRQGIGKVLEMGAQMRLWVGRGGHAFAGFLDDPPFPPRLALVQHREKARVNVAAVGDGPDRAVKPAPILAPCQPDPQAHVEQLRNAKRLLGHFGPDAIGGHQNIRLDRLAALKGDGVPSAVSV